MRVSKYMIGLVTCVALCMPALGQDGGTGREGGRRGMVGGREVPQLPPEKAKAAWQAQANRVATALKLEKDKPAQLEAAYIASRESNIKAIREAREEVRSRVRGQDRATAVAEEQRVMDEIRYAERAKFESMLKQFLPQEQVDKAMPLLGSFDVQWDFMVDGLNEIKLEPDKHAQAMEHVEKYILAMHEARNATERETMRQKSVDARRKLNESMRGVLTTEQMHDLNKAMNFGRDPGLGRGGRGGEGERPRRPRDGERTQSNPPGGTGDRPPGDDNQEDDAEDKAPDRD